MSVIHLFDILMVYLNEDWHAITKLCDILYKCISIDGREVSICSDLLDVHDKKKSLNGKLDFFELALERSNCAFLFFGDQPADNWTKVYQDMVQMAVIHKRGIKLIPVKLHADVDVPRRFEMYHCIELSQLLRGASLLDIDVSSVTADQLDQRILKNIINTLSEARKTKQKKLDAAHTYTYRSYSAYKRATDADQVIPQNSSPISQPSVSDLNSHSHSQILQKNFVYLTEIIVIDAGLLDDLYASGVINDREKAKVTSASNTYERVEELLFLLLRKSRREFNEFINALNRTNQEHVSDKLLTTLTKEC